MKRIFIWTPAAIVAAGALFFWWNMESGFGKPSETSINASSQSKTTDPTLGHTENNDGRSSAVQWPPRAKRLTDIAEEFKSSNDYWAFAHKYLSAATAGDPSAQYYLWRAMTRCASDNKMFFLRRGETLTLEQGVDWAAKRQLPTTIAQAVFQRCHGFLTSDNSDLGNANDWLAEATAAKQPQAQSATALALFNQQALQSVKQQANLDAEPTGIQSDGLNPRELLREAVESENPDVIFSIGEAQGFLATPGTDVKISQLAWFLVACQRGLDCSRDSEWVQISCLANVRCASIENPSQFLQILADQDWNSVSDAATDIKSKLDAGRWDDLGIGS